MGKAWEDAASAVALLLRPRPQPQAEPPGQSLARGTPGQGEGATPGASPRLGPAGGAPGQRGPVAGAGVRVASLSLEDVDSLHSLALGPQLGGLLLHLHTALAACTAQVWPALSTVSLPPLNPAPMASPLLPCPLPIPWCCHPPPSLATGCRSSASSERRSSQQKAPPRPVPSGELSCAPFPRAACSSGSIADRDAINNAEVKLPMPLPAAVALSNGGASCPRALPVLQQKPALGCCSGRGGAGPRNPTVPMPLAPVLCSSSGWGLLRSSVAVPCGLQALLEAGHCGDVPAHAAPSAERATAAATTRRLQLTTGPRRSWQRWCE